MGRRGRGCQKQEGKKESGLHSPPCFGRHSSRRVSSWVQLWETLWVELQGTSHCTSGLQSLPPFPDLLSYLSHGQP